jgi:hypothetical protein
VNTGRRNRIAVVSLVASLSLLLAGCGPKDSTPTSSGSSPTASAAGGASAGTDTQGLAIQGETAIGPFGDPCALLTAAEVSSAVGFTVTGETRGKVIGTGANATQNCVFLTNGPSLVGPMAAALGAMSGQDPTAITNAVNAAGGIVGITLSVADASMATGSVADSGSGSTEPGVAVKPLPDLGAAAAAISLPSGGVAFAVKGTTVIMLMVLIDGKISTDGTEQMLRSAYGKVK